MRTRTTLLVAVLVAVSGSVAAAQQLEAPRSKTNGFNVGIYLNGAALQVENVDEIDSGGGLGIRFGYGFNQNLEIVVDGQAAEMSTSGSSATYTLAHFDLGARYSFGSAASAARPYFAASLSGRSASVPIGTTSLDIRGGGVGLGGGLRYFFSPSFAIDGGLGLTYGSFSEGRIGSDAWQDLGGDSFNGTSTRLNVGLSWHP
jgi:hypothetical protein